MNRVFLDLCKDEFGLSLIKNYYNFFFMQKQNLEFVKLGKIFNYFFD
jgi:hypothetical protein